MKKYLAWIVVATFGFNATVVLLLIFQDNDDDSVFTALMTIGYLLPTVGIYALFYGKDFAKHRPFFVPSWRAILLFVALFFSSAYFENPWYLFPSLVVWAFCEQWIYFAPNMFIKTTRKRFIFLMLGTMVFFVLIHGEYTIVIFSLIAQAIFYMYPQLAKRNLWHGTILHASSNLVVLMRDTDSVQALMASNSDEFVLDRVIIYFTFLTLFVFLFYLYTIFGTRKHTRESILYLRVFFPTAIGRAVLLVMLWIFQWPQDLWRKFVRREPNFEYGPRIIMSALREDVRAHPVRLRKGKASVSSL